VLAAGLHSVLLIAALGAAQLLPPAVDGDIRTAYYELQNRSEIWLTLEPRSAKGERAPLMTLAVQFAGKRQTTAPHEVEVQAFAGQFWAPRAELWFELDGGERVDLSALPGAALLQGAADDYWSGRVTIDVMRRLAGAHRITGSSLGFPFELSASQRQAIRAWLERITPRS
jgi:hypothetical protein